MSNPRILIVGAGIIGLAIAWQLRRRGQRNIVVVEKGSGLGEGSTGASSAICRYRYSTPQMIRLARAGIESYQNWGEFTGLSDRLAQFHRLGMLWFTGSDVAWADREQRQLAGHGVRSEVLDNAALVEAFPAINPCTVPVDLADPESHRCGGEGRHLLEVDGGHMDPVDTAQDLLTACRRAGVDVRFNSLVRRVLQRGGRVDAAMLGEGGRMDCDIVINAAGPWCNQLYAGAGVASPMPLAPVRIQMVHINRSSDLVGAIPVCADLQNGIYFRTQNRGQQLLVGSVRVCDERESVDDPDNYRRVADDVFLREKLHLLQHRLPALKLDRSIRDYCGLYTVNLTDVHPLIGQLGPDGFFAVNGFSGHGFKLAPAIGAMVARLVTGDVLPGEDPRDDGWLAPDREPIELASHSVLA